VIFSQSTWRKNYQSRQYHPEKPLEYQEMDKSETHQQQVQEEGKMQVFLTEQLFKSLYGCL
jgi:hypothetical protein